jgi:nitrogen fixation protein NifX
MQAYADGDGHSDLAERLGIATAESLAIGGSAAARLIKKGVTPVKAKSEEEEIADVLNKLVQTLKGNPPPWLRKALQQKTTNFEDEIENEAKV